MASNNNTAAPDISTITADYKANVVNAHEYISESRKVALASLKRFTMLLLDFAPQDVRTKFLQEYATLENALKLLDEADDALNKQMQDMLLEYAKEIDPPPFTE